MGIDLNLSCDFNILDGVRIQDSNDGTKLLPQLLVPLPRHILADELDSFPRGLFEVVHSKLLLDEWAGHWDS